MASLADPMVLESSPLSAGCFGEVQDSKSPTVLEEPESLLVLFRAVVCLNQWHCRLPDSIEAMHVDDAASSVAGFGPTAIPGRDPPHPTGILDNGSPGVLKFGRSFSLPDDVGL